jgi:hypothetical protein
VTAELHEATAPEGQAESEPEKEKMVLIAASGDLDKAWPVFILATTGAAYGMDVTVFFTFWGLGILKKPDAGLTGDDWRQKMLSAFSKGSPDKLGLSKLNFAGMPKRRTWPRFRSCSSSLSRWESSSGPAR